MTGFMRKYGKLKEAERPYDINGIMGQRDDINTCTHVVYQEIPQNLKDQLEKHCILPNSFYLAETMGHMIVEQGPGPSSWCDHTS